MPLSKSANSLNNNRNRSPFWFYFVLILIPVLLFVLLEIFLGIIRYGRNNEQWIKISETKQMLNPDIAGRYFFNTKDLPQSNNDAFDIVKRKNAFRIFVMGESSTQGFPFSPNGTFSRYIRDRLELIYPDIHFEVINLGITATNSYTLRDLLPEVIEQKPDLILIYAGHNEYYGALGVGSNENIGNSREFVNFLIWLNQFKTVELLRNVVSAISSLFNNDSEINANRHGTLMARIVDDQLIPFNSESFQIGIKQFEGNLKDVLYMTKEAGVPVVIGTLVSNLKDQKPFISLGSNTDTNADSIYSKALEQLDNKNNPAADSLFRKAKDFDALRFRAPEAINRIIKKLSKEYDCCLVNVDSIFNYLSPDGIVGNNLIVDHLHPSLNGYLVMGKIYFDAIRQNNLLPKEDGIQMTDEKQDSIVVTNFAFSSLDSMIANIRLQGLLNDWPFVESPDFSFINHLYLKDIIDSIAYKVAVENVNWEKAHREAAQYYLLKKNYKDFAKEYSVIVSQYPFKLNDYDYAASTLIEAKQYALAYNLLIKRFRESPDAFSAKWLGNINLNQNNTDEAIKYLSLSVQFDSKDAQTFYNLAGAYIQKMDYQNALKAIENCILITPDFPNAQGIRTQLTNIIK